LGVEKEKIVIAALDAEGENDEEGIGEVFGAFDMDGEVCTVDAAWFGTVLAALGSVSVKELCKLCLKRSRVGVGPGFAVEERLRGDIQRLAKHNDVAADLSWSVKLQAVCRDFVGEQLVLQA
jgi:hypothetical protein